MHNGVIQLSKMWCLPSRAHSPVREADLHVNNSYMRLIVIKGTRGAGVEDLYFSHCLDHLSQAASVLINLRYVVFSFSYILISVSLLEITNPGLES